MKSSTQKEVHELISPTTIPGFDVARGEELIWPQGFSTGRLAGRPRPIDVEDGPVNPAPPDSTHTPNEHFVTPTNAEKSLADLKFDRQSSSARSNNQTPGFQRQSTQNGPTRRKSSSQFNLVEPSRRQSSGLFTMTAENPVLDDVIYEDYMSKRKQPKRRSSHLRCRTVAPAQLVTHVAPIIEEEYVDVEVAEVLTTNNLNDSQDGVLFNTGGGSSQRQLISSIETGGGDRTLVTMGTVVEGFDKTALKKAQTEDTRARSQTVKFGKLTQVREIKRNGTTVEYNQKASNDDISKDSSVKRMKKDPIPWKAGFGTINLSGKAMDYDPDMLSNPPAPPPMPKQLRRLRQFNDQKTSFLRIRSLVTIMGMFCEHKYLTEEGKQADEVNNKMIAAVESKELPAPLDRQVTMIVDLQTGEQKPGTVMQPLGFSYSGLVGKFTNPFQTKWSSMTRKQKQDKIQYLWRRIRILAKRKGLLQRVMYEKHQEERDRFGLDPNISQQLDPEQQVEEKLVYEDKDALTDLPWYIMSPNSLFYRIQNMQIQMMTWITVILTPMSLVFSLIGGELQDQLLWLVWLNDISWCVEILLSFIVASPKNRTFSTISKAYFKGFFIFDFLATVPPMITLQQDQRVNLFKFLRFVHIGEMFTPFRKLIDFLMQGQIEKKRSDIFQLVVLFSSALLLGHIAACAWTALGTLDDGWLNIMQNYSLDDGGDPQFQEYEPYQVYIFSMYWCFTVLTTVGYGDFAGGNTGEYVFSIILEFCGLSFFALLTGLIPPLVTPEQDYESMLMEKTADLDIWIKKLQQANSPITALYVPSTLYLCISETVEEAFRNDHNLIIEEYGFYQQLPPTQQTKVIELIFGEFTSNFNHFFGACDRGFVNEAIISLYSRRYAKAKSGRKCLVRAQYKMLELFFTMEGTFAAFHPSQKVRGKSQKEQPAILMPRYSVFGDYQLLFDLYPRMEFGPYTPTRQTSEETIEELGPDAYVDEFRTMCLDEKVFLDLCELYPSTKTNLKILGLAKREMFMNEEEAEKQLPLTQLIYKGEKRFHQVQLGVSSEMGQASPLTPDLRAQNKWTDEKAADIFDNVALHLEEQDVDEPDEQLNEQRKAAKKTQKKLDAIMNKIEPLIFDIKDGTMKRVAPSRFIKRQVTTFTISEESQDSMMIDNEKSSFSENSSVSVDSSDRANLRRGRTNTSHITCQTIKSKQQRIVSEAIETARSSVRKRAGSLLKRDVSFVNSFNAHHAGASSKDLHLTSGYHSQNK